MEPTLAERERRCRVCGSECGMCGCRLGGCHPDDESPPTLADKVDQTRRMRDIVARLTLLSYTSAARIDTETARQKPTGGDRPPGDPNPLHLEFWWRFISEPSFDKREIIICEAEDARIAVQKGPEEKPEGETREQRDARMIREGEGFEVEWVARVFKCGPRDVIKARLNAKRDPSTGRLIEPVDPETRKALVVQLVKVENVSMRMCAQRLGVGYSTVLRDLGKKAA